MKWAGFIRVSHMGQRTPGAENVHTDREQVADIRAAAKKLGGTLELLDPEYDVSGAAPLAERPSLRRAIEGVEAGEYAGIIVAYLSRLGRNTREQLAAWDRVEAAGGRIVVVKENIDTSTPSGRMLRTILLANAQRELEEHTERFEGLRERATAAGVWQRRQTPRGYTRDPETRRLVPDDRADEVREAFAARARGASLGDLAQRLGMTRTGVQQLLANRVYLGELRVGAHVNVAAHPPLVAPDAFQAAQRVQVARKARSGLEPSLLTGLLRCCGCGHTMTRQSGGAGAARAYACKPLKGAGHCPAPAAIGCHIIDPYVERIALQQLRKLQATSIGPGAELDAARARLARAEAELAEFLAAVSAADLGAEDYAAAARARREKRDMERAAVARLAVQEDAMGADPVETWHRLDGAQRNRLLRGLLTVVLVRAAGRPGRTPVEDRVRVIDSEDWRIVLPGGGEAAPIRSLDLPDLDDPAVLRVEVGQ